MLGFHEDYQEVVVTDADDPSNILFVNPADDTVLRTFGSQRSSMFILGCATADDLSLTSLTADLDGYLMLGKDGVVSSAYSARNTENHIQIQSGDLPERTFKTR
ncbi:hypothetical protein SCOR_26670 [Sulfidibacter corallicola]|uniref:Uncharacterized protein n=1 Tax=Sulfidibacter corallicola TaxID=2818388 RepID=A0A8A4TP42_SULCO|nr:hypothetical protein [Sulfidibacter corallicola]QTD50862.1 hypothetical protein J3U87_00205 [Sulfidibacter corallicola]